MKVYKTNHRLYVVLLVLSIAVVFCACFFLASSKWFSILTGFGCGGVASVLVAWLIDIASCRQKDITNAKVFEHLFQSFDSQIPWILGAILTDTAKRNSAIDVDSTYSVSQIIEIVKTEDGNLPDWKTYYHNTGVAFFSIDPAILLSYDPTETHSKLYSMLFQGRNMHESYIAIQQRGNFVVKTEDGMPTTSFEYDLLCGDLALIDRILKERNIYPSICVFPESKSEIIRLREATVEE